MPKARSPESPQRWAEGTESKERSLGNRVWRTELREPSLGSHGQRPGPGELCLARPAWRAELRGLCMRAEPVPNPAAPKGESHPHCLCRSTGAASTCPGAGQSPQEHSSPPPAAAPGWEPGGIIRGQDAGVWRQLCHGVGWSCDSSHLVLDGASGHSPSTEHGG